jgi:hypothetical protein
MPAFSQELFDTICERIADGESLRSICRDEDMPAASTVIRWIAADETLRERYARSREAQADAIFDEILEIADDARNDWMDGKEGSAADVLNSENIQRSRLRIDARKWMAGKLRPKVYGDKLDLTHGNPDGTPIQFQTIIETKPQE